MDDEEAYQLAKELFEEGPEEPKRKLLESTRMILRFRILNELESRGEKLPPAEEIHIDEQRVEEETIKLFAETLRNHHARVREWVTTEEQQDIYNEELKRAYVLHADADWFTRLPDDYQKNALRALALEATMDRLRQKYPQAF